jgi:hypothetical protein
VAEGGSWNWVLVGPDAVELALLGGGSGSVDEMRACGQQHDDLVMFGLLRLGFGVGRLKRTKYAFVHLIGPKVSAVKRGRINAVRPAMEAALKKFANCSVAFSDLAAEDLSLEGVIERVRQVSVVDDDLLAGDEGAHSSIFSLEAFQQAMAQEQASEEHNEEAEESENEEEAEQARGGESLPSPENKVDTEAPTPRSPPNARLEVGETLRLVRHDRTCNWALFRLRHVAAAQTFSPISSFAQSSPASSCEEDVIGSTKNDTGNYSSSSGEPFSGSVREIALRFQR